MSSPPMKNSTLSPMPDCLPSMAQDRLIQACEHNQIKDLLFLLNTPDLRKSLLFYNHSCFEMACRLGHLEIVKILTTHPSMVNVRNYLDAHWSYDGFFQAISHGHLNVVDFLLTDLRLNPQLNIHHQNDEALRLACRFGHLDLVDFLLCSPKLKKHSSQLGSAFLEACEKDHLEVVQYFMFRRKQIQGYSDGLIYALHWCDFCCWSNRSIDFIRKQLLSEKEIQILQDLLAPEMVVGEDRKRI